MESTTSQPVQPNPTRFRSPTPLAGEVHRLLPDGTIAQTWQLPTARCTLGSDPRNAVAVEDPSLAPQHALVVFGKHRSMVRAEEGAVRIDGRWIRESLIDQPTLIQCGTVRWLIVPPQYLGLPLHAADWAGPSDDSFFPQPSAGVGSRTSASPGSWEGVGSDPSPPRVEGSWEGSSGHGRASGEAEPTSRTPWELASLERVLAPLQQAMEQTSQSLLSLQHVVGNSDARLEQWLQVSQTRSAADDPAGEDEEDWKQVVARLDQRVEGAAQGFESLVQQFSQQLDLRLERLGGLLEKLNAHADSPREVASSWNDEPSASGEAWEEPSASAVPSPSAVPSAVPSASAMPSTVAGSWDLDFQPSVLNPWMEWREGDEPSGAAADEHPPAMGQAVESALTAWPMAEAAPPTGEEAVEEGAVAWGGKAYAESSSPADALLDLAGDIKPRTTAASDPRVQGDFEESTASETAVTAQSLPAWFTGIEVGPGSSAGVEPVAEEKESAAIDGGDWGSVRLNPIYAEDTSQWMEVIEPTDQEAATNPDAPGLAGTADRSLSELSEMPARPVAEEFADAGTDEGSQPLADEFEHRSGFPSVQPQANDGSDVEDGGEESIEAYMERLLQRVKTGTAVDTGEKSSGPGKNVRSPAITRPASEPIQTLPVPKREAEATAAELDSRFQQVSERISALDPSSLQYLPPTVEDEAVRRSATAQRLENLQALRELANSTARTAIMKSTRRRMELGIMTKLMIAAMGLMGGGILLVLNGFHANIAMLGAVCAFAVFLLWSYEAIVQSRDLRKSHAKTKPGQPNAAE